MEPAKTKAILYADIFDYPLTAKELEKWKIVDRELGFIPRLGPRGIKNYKLRIREKGSYFFLQGRDKIVILRKKREKISQIRIKKARKAATFLARISFIKFVAITGNLAMKNSQKEDDIDLLIITQRGTLWLTRLLATILLDLQGIRRKPNDKNSQDKICLNMFLEDHYLTLPRQEQDLYGAHEVCQVKPLFDKDNTYLRFLKANSWARRFLPNAMVGIRNQEKPFVIHNSFSSIEHKLRLFIILELLSKFLQLLYMKRHRTTEVITPHMLRFHPCDYRQKVFQAYQKRLKRYG